jgi:hypothetical protein
LFAYIIENRRQKTKQPVTRLLDCSDLSSLAGEAIAAVDGTTGSGLKGHLGGRAALIAGYAVELTVLRHSAAVVVTLAAVATGLATAGLVLESAFGVKLLLTPGKQKLRAAVLAIE